MTQLTVSKGRGLVVVAGSALEAVAVPKARVLVVVSTAGTPIEFATSVACSITATGDLTFTDENIKFYGGDGESFFKGQKFFGSIA